MENEVMQYMVEFTLPSLITERFSSHIPEQRAKVNQYFQEGKLASYGVSLDGGRCWAVFNADSEGEVLSLVRALPLTQFCHFRIHFMTFYNLVTAKVPNFSIN